MGGRHGPQLRDSVDRQANLPLLGAIAEYVEAVSGQHGDRLEALLASTGLNGHDPIAGTEAARRLGVSHQRMYQIVQQLYRARDRACPAAGIWMPQVSGTEESGWPQCVTPIARAAVQSFLPARTAANYGP
jgi:hypothetical protein